MKHIYFLTFYYKLYDARNESVMKPVEIFVTRPTGNLSIDRPVTGEIYQILTGP